jgi:hypothetical protein
MTRADDQPPMRRFTIICETDQDDDAAPLRLRKLLKLILRRLNLRCVSIDEVSQDRREMRECDRTA